MINKQVVVDFFTELCAERDDEKLLVKRIYVGHDENKTLVALCFTKMFKSYVRYVFEIQGIHPIISNIYAMKVDFQLAMWYISKNDTELEEFHKSLLSFEELKNIKDTRIKYRKFHK